MHRLLSTRVDHHMTRLGISVLVAALVVSLVGCQADPVPEPPIQYDLTVSSSEGGLVDTPGEAAFTYEAGTVVELVAVPDECHRFVNWTGDDVVNPDSATTTITMDAAKSVTANFALLRYDLTVASTEGGSVIAPGEGTFSYDCGTLVHLVAEAGDGYRFVDWTGDVRTIADASTYATTIIMNANYEITANFVAQYVLTIGSTDGGEVILPGEGTFTYDADTVVPVIAEAQEGYRFVSWTGDVDTVVYTTSAYATITMNDHYAIAADFEELDPQRLFAGGSGTEQDPYRIADWHHLSNVRYLLGTHYRLMNDLDATTSGYAELASLTANHGRGWQPIGSLYVDPSIFEYVAPEAPFAGRFDGQGYEIRDLVINRHREILVGLFGDLQEGGVVENLGVVNADVTGDVNVGALVGGNRGGIVRDCYSTGNVSGSSRVGGLLGYHGAEGIVSNSHSSASVTGDWQIGGLVGWHHFGTVGDSYATGNVAGGGDVGGLIGSNWHGLVRNSYYDHDRVLINGKNMITTGALFDKDFEQWLANGKFLDVNERLSQEGGYYVIDTVSDFRELLPFGQDHSLRFRLNSDLDLGNEANFYIPYFGGEFDGNDHKVSNLSLNFDSLSQIGLFGYLAFDGRISRVCVENVNIATNYGSGAGGLVGFNDGILSASHSTGRVAGRSGAGGLVGVIHNGTVINCYSGGRVTGRGMVGGLVGFHFHGTISNSHYNYDEVLINGKNLITVGALFAADFEQWLENGRFLDVNERLSKETGYYVIDNISDLEQLLAFGQDDSLRFRLKSDLDLGSVPDFYIPHLAGEFDGNGHKISNLKLNLDCVSTVGLFGYLARGGKITNVTLEETDIVGDSAGGLVGHNYGTVSNCWADGSVTGRGSVGGLVGHSRGTVRNCHSSGSVRGDSQVGGLVGDNLGGTISDCYSTSSATGDGRVGGLVGANYYRIDSSYSAGSVTGEADTGGLVGFSIGTVSNSFWDMDTSGQSTSAGGTGKTTAEMKNIATFRTAGWSIAGVAAGETDRSRTWNIVDGQTYPFLSWQRVS